MGDLLYYGQEIWDKRYPEIAAMRDDLAERIVADETKQQIGKDWDILLNLADRELSYVDITRSLASEPTPREFAAVLPRGRTIFDSYRRDLSYRPVLVDTSCGSSGGMGTYGAITTATYEVTKGVTSISGGEKTLQCKSCPLCGTPDVTATIADGKITCPICKESVQYDC